MPIIKINKSYQIKSTPHTWEIQKLVRRNQHSIEWRFIANYNTAENALRSLREMLIRLKGDLTYEMGMQRGRSGIINGSQRAKHSI
jgi:hypothetical protein